MTSRNLLKIRIFSICLSAIKKDSLGSCLLVTQLHFSAGKVQIIFTTMVSSILRLCRSTFGCLEVQAELGSSIHSLSISLKTGEIHTEGLCSSQNVVIFLFQAFTTFFSKILTSNFLVLKISLRNLKIQMQT